MNRRVFLASGAVAAWGARPGFGDEIGGKPPRVALIGCGWYGKSDLMRLIQVAPVNIVGLCDADSRMMGEAAEWVAQRQPGAKKPRLQKDYRELLAEKDLDLVLVETPDHWHTLQGIAAMEAGADLYVQKPISVDVTEGKALLEAARRLKRVVQVGTQRRSTPHLVEALEKVIKPGLLGKIVQADIYCYYHMRAKGNPADTAPPATLDYDLWTGPAPMRPFNPMVHPRGWRAFWEYGNGILGDMCIHMLDMVRWMLDLGWPSRVSSTGGIWMDKASKANIPDTQTAVFEFDGLSVSWNHRTWGDAPDPAYPWGATIYGDKGHLKLSVNQYEFFPSGSRTAKLSGKAVMEEDKYPEDRTEKDLERHVASAVRAHLRDWLKAVATRGKPVADIEQGHISTASCVLANRAMQVGRTLRYDPASHTVLGDAEATALLTREYRAPWRHPGKG
jgi:predicted dehydrogenase